MALVFAAIVPHSPVLIPHIGKDNLSSLSTTVNSLHRLANELKMIKPDTLVCISSHLNTPQAALVFNIRPTYRATFDAFGDFGPGLAINGDTVFAHYLKRRFDTERDKMPVIVTSEEKLDYSLGVPLTYLLQPLPQLRIVPIGDTLEDHRLHLKLGQRLRRSIYQERQRVAVIASANLSHRLSEQSPAGFSPKAKDFDRRVLKAIAENRPSSLARIQPSTLAEVQFCGIKAMLLLYGILDGLSYRPEIMSYENAFGIGIATVALRF